MAIAAVLSSASTTNIRWFLWLFYFLSLSMSQSCLADHDQFNFNHGRLFSRKFCPGRCSMKFELQPFFRDSTVSESMHLSASSSPRRNWMKNRASKMYLSVSAVALVLIAVSSTWHMRRRDALFEGEDRSGNDNSHDTLRRESENQMVSERRPLFPLDVIRKFKKYISFETKIRNQVEFQGLPSFPLKVILKATQQFSDERILGKGSFGVVYKRSSAADDQLHRIGWNCGRTPNNTASTTFTFNLGRLFSRKLYDEGDNSIYYQTTDGDDPDKVYGLYLCRGDVTKLTCQNCINSAIDNLIKECVKLYRPGV
ncbi:hypothetical protein EZV62_026407 [Acer yangbiense]|uniref:Gnk2-homologous domain-containing protein n=1 Tax=Acer yangbiense TaxID=1000413 RepID=A0A5C7GR90_9ROSI|nr:hypothetical protein EZV62_026407 [Acer yangbiense]